MNTIIRKSVIYSALGVILIAGLVSCTGEKGTTSYPVAKLNPERISPRHLLHKVNHENSDAVPEKVQNPNAIQQVIARMQPANSCYQVSSETGRSLAPPAHCSAEALNVNRMDQSLLASTRNEPEINFNNPGLPKISYNTITRDDTTFLSEKRSDNENYIRQRKDPKEKNGFGIVSLVTGIASLLFPYLAPVAIVFGAIGLNKRQRGLAIAGMVLGIITFVIYVGVILLFLIALSGPGIR